MNGIAGFAEQRHLQRPSPWRRELGSDIVQDVLEQIREASVGEAGLGLCGSRRERATPEDI